MLKFTTTVKKAQLELQSGKHAQTVVVNTNQKILSGHYPSYHAPPRDNEQLKGTAQSGFHIVLSWLSYIVVINYK